MSVENKIREMMTQKLDEAFPGMGKNKEDKAPSQGSSQSPEVQMMHKGGVNAEKPTNPVNSLQAGSGPKENAPMKQGSSQDASIDLETDQSTQGKAQAGKAKKQPVPTQSGAGAAPNYTVVADPSSVINQASSKGNVYKEETEETDIEETEEEFISEEEYNALSDEEKAEYEAVELYEEEEDEDDDEEEDEEVEQIDELSPATIRSYEGKAVKDLETHDNIMKRQPGFEKKAAKRHKGIQAARSKTGRMLRGMREELANDVANLFAEEVDLSEEFKTKAASLFEAVVTARVTHEVEKMQEIVAEEAVEAVATLYEDMVSKVDAYLSYVAQQWLQNNDVAIESGLRTEVTEDFIAGLKVLFQENYIEVPEEKHDVLGEMQAQIDELTAKVNESMAKAVELNTELTEAKREVAFTKATSDLARTEAEKLRGLVEEVEFENEAMFEQKISVIKNNYFPKSTVVSPITEEAVETQEVSGTVAKYAEMLSRNTFGK